MYARGGVHGVQAKIREMNKSVGDVPEKLMVDALYGKQSAENLHDIRPEISAQRISDWLFINNHNLQSKNHLKSNKQVVS